METKGLASRVILILGALGSPMASGDIHKLAEESPSANETALTVNGLKLSGKLRSPVPRKFELTEEGWLEYSRLTSQNQSVSTKPPAKTPVDRKKTILATNEGLESEDDPVIREPIKKPEKAESLPPDIAKAFDAMTKAYGPVQDSEIKILVLDRLKGYVTDEVGNVLEQIKGDLRSRKINQLT